MDRAQLIDFLEEKGYVVGSDINPEGVAGFEMGLYRNLKTGCLWPFGAHIMVHVGTLDVTRNELRVYGSPVMSEMNALKESLEERCVKRFYLTLAGEEMDYFN